MPTDDREEGRAEVLWPADPSSVDTRGPAGAGATGRTTLRQSWGTDSTLHPVSSVARFAWAQASPSRWTGGSDLHHFTTHPNPQQGERDWTVPVVVKHSQLFRVVVLSYFYFSPFYSTKTTLANDIRHLFNLKFLVQTSQSHNHTTRGASCFGRWFICLFFFFSTVLLKVSFNNWKMDFFFGWGEQTKQLLKQLPKLPQLRSQDLREDRG